MGILPKCSSGGKLAKYLERYDIREIDKRSKKTNYRRRGLIVGITEVKEVYWSGQVSQKFRVCD